MAWYDIKFYNVVLSLRRSDIVLYRALPYCVMTDYMIAYVIIIC